MLAAEAIAELVELGVHLPLVCEVPNVSRVEPRQALPLPLDVGRDAGAFDRHPIGLAVPGASSSAVVAGWVGIPALERIASAERVTEDPRRLVRDEGVLAAPAGAVPRAEGVEVDDAPVLVETSAVLGRPVAVDGTAEVGQPAEDVVEPAAPGPVGVSLEDGERAGPVREVDGPGTLVEGGLAAIGQRRLLGDEGAAAATALGDEVPALDQGGERLRRVEREMPSWSASSRSAGSRLPALSRPSLIAVPRRSTVSSKVLGALTGLNTASRAASRSIPPTVAGDGRDGLRD